MPTSIVEQYWSGVVRRLQAEVDVFNRLIGHAAEQGRENEAVLATLLTNLLPASVGVGTGIVIDSGSRRSRQSDVILYDPLSQPSVMAQVSQMLFPVEVVSGLIEVKTTLEERDLADFTKKKEAFAALQAQDDRSVEPFFALFAYHAWAAPKTVIQKIDAMDSSARPDLFCVVSPGLVGRYLSSDAEPQTSGLAPLHATDNEGSRVSMSWRHVGAIPPGGMEVVDGTPYPVTKIPGIGNIIGEPGRALLLFSTWVLQHLADHHNLPSPVIRHYIDERGKEVMQF